MIGTIGDFLESATDGWSVQKNYPRFRAKTTISDLFWTNPTWNRPVTKNLSGKLQSHLSTKSVNKTSRHAMSAARFPAKPRFSAHSWTRSFSSSLLYLSWAFLFLADKYVRRKKVDPGIELSSLNGRDSVTSQKSWLTEMRWDFLDHSLFKG